MVRVTGFEPAASCSQSRRATNCATPGYLLVQAQDLAYWLSYYSTSK